MASFNVKKLIDIRIFGIDLSMTNSSLFMLITVGIICFVLYICTKEDDIIPSRPFFAVEQLFGFVGDTVNSSFGNKSVVFFPYILTLFLFIFVGNLIGLVPFAFCFTSQIIVTFGLSFIVFLCSMVVGIREHGIGYFHRFVPSGVPVIITPLLIVIEVISFLFRPISMGVRLFANMMAGHMMLDIIASFAVLFICGDIFLKPLSVLPIALNVILTLLKLLVCFIQAYIFMMLSCVYLGEALGKEH